MALLLAINKVVFAAHEINGINYNIYENQGRAEVTSKNPRYSGDIVIPSEIEYKGSLYRVTDIDETAFDDCHGLKSLDIPPTITNISCHFYDCEQLNKVNIHDIGAWCKIVYGYYPYNRPQYNPLYFAHNLYLDNELINEIQIPEGIEVLQSCAFIGCTNLLSLKLPNSLTIINSQAFKDCTNLASVSIPNSVLNIYDEAFYGCHNLKQVELCDGDKYLTCDDDIFGQCPIQKVYLGRDMGTDIFKSHNEIKEVIIGRTVTKVYSFNLCEGIHTLTIPKNVRILDGFHGCSGLKHLILEDGDEILEMGSMFSINKHIETIHLGRNLEYIVTTYSSAPFRANYALENLTIGECVTELGEQLFWGCKKLKDFIIPNSVVNIGRGCFDDCISLQSVVIPNSVKTIGSFAFSDCKKLKTVTIGKNVTDIGYGAFDSGDDEDYTIGSLTRITSFIEKPFEVLHIFRYWTPINQGSRYMIQANDTLFVPKGTVPLYKSTDDWYNVKYILEIEESTDIVEISNSTQKDNSAYYNLNGIVETKPRKGIYIKKGKKVIIK